MKNIIIITIIALFGLSMFSGCMSYSRVSAPAHASVYEDVNGDQNELFLKSNDWMVSTFGNAESVIQYSDKEEGVIIGKYLLSGRTSSSRYGTTDTRVYAKIDVRVKDNRAKIEITPVGEWAYDKSGMTVYKYSPEDAKKDMNNLSRSFYLALQANNLDW